MTEAESRNSIPESFHDLLAAKTVAVIATIGPKGEPQASPVWFGWQDGVIRFMVSPTYQKLKNLQRDPRLTVTIVDPTNIGRYIEIRGTATIGNDVDDRMADAMARKYLDKDHLPWATADIVNPVITVTPLRIITMG